MELNINFREIVSAFMVLFAIIDITGSLPIILGLKSDGKKIESGKAALFSFIIYMHFLFIGDGILGLFGVDISSFAVAGSLVILVLAVEMILGVELFKNDSPGGSVTIVPIIFPLIAGAGGLTTVVSLRAEYEVVNIIIALILNMLIVWAVLAKASIAERLLGKGGIYVLRKFFGIILLAIAVKLFVTNIVVLF